MGCQQWMSCAQATTQAFLAGGYMQTGDIFEQRGPSEIHWIDRRGNVMKLSQVHAGTLCAAGAAAAG